ncbi:MAG TPA: TorF family putative porin [Sphingobium sp.]
MRKSTFLIPLAMIAAPLPAAAQDDGGGAATGSAVTVSGSVTGISQYRLRGISFSDEGMAVQGGVTAAHKSGFYVGAWASSLAGYGTFGGANMELDLLGGYSTALGDATIDGGLVWYMFPGTNDHQYAELYASVSYPLGPVKAKLGVNYAPRRASIGDADNLWVYGDVALPIAGTPVTLKGHVGHTNGEGSIYAGPRGHYFDYSAGADVAWKRLTFNLSYVGTDIDRDEADAYYTLPGAKRGREIVDGAALFSITAAF